MTRGRGRGGVRSARFIAAMAGALSLDVLGERARSRAVAAHPDGPLASTVPLPAISVIAPVGPADVDVAAWSLTTSLPNILNPITEINIATPTAEIGERVVSEMKNEEVNIPARVCVDGDLLCSVDVTAAVGRWPRARQGWVAQQAVKLILAAQASEAGALIIDADTALIRPRVFLDRDYVGLLMPTFELHGPYYEHLGRVFGDEFSRPIRGWSHVSHHLLVQPTLVRAMLDEVRARHGKPPIAALVELADPAVSSCCSLDYEAYAEWCLRRAPTRVREVRWGNTAVLRGNEPGLPNGSADPFSISRHHHVER